PLIAASSAFGPRRRRSNHRSSQLLEDLVLHSFPAISLLVLSTTLTAEAQTDPQHQPEAEKAIAEPDSSARAAGEDHHILEPRAPTSAASAETIRDRDLVLRPRATPEDILRVVPGLVIAQHQGGGKADQLFLRGFDADHGTDVALFIDGTPINLPSHGHGQG